MKKLLTIFLIAVISSLNTHYLAIIAAEPANQSTPVRLNDSSNSIESLKLQLEKLQREFEETQRRQLQQIESLKMQIEALEKGSATPVKKEEIQSQSAIIKTNNWREEIVSSSAAKKWNPAAPIRLIGSGNNYLDLSLDALVAAGSSTEKHVDELQLGGHDPSQRGFTLQQMEMVFNGAVDPYFTGQANVVYKLDSSGESDLELEEIYADTLSLPMNLQVRVGQFYSDFGRINNQHPHQWNFVDAPIVITRLLGEDGLRNLGVRISWLMPLPFYSELFFAIQNSGGTASSFRGSGHHHNDEGEDNDLLFGRPRSITDIRTFGDLLFVPRYAVSFDLTESQTLLAGVSAAFGPNSSGTRGHTEIYGTDVMWKWKPRYHHGGFPFVSVQSEFLIRRYTADEFNWDLNGNGLVDPGEYDFNNDGVPDFLPREKIDDYGFYTELNWGFKKGWVASVRGEYVTAERALYEQILGLDESRLTRKRLSTALSWYLSEFSKLRIQYNYDYRQIYGPDHSIWVQFEFLLGQHAAHKF